MIGKSLRQRHVLAPLASEAAVLLLKDALAGHAAKLVQIRAQDPRMIVCLILRADEASIRLCRRLGFHVKRGGSGAFGLLGVDAASLFAPLEEARRAWLETPCEPRETKVFLVAGGTALVSLHAGDGNVVLTALD